MSDTPPELQARYIEHLRRLTVAERWTMLGRLVSDARELARMGLRERHPDAGPRELDIRLAALLYGREAASRLGPVPLDAAVPVDDARLP